MTGIINTFVKQICRRTEDKKGSGDGARSSDPVHYPAVPFCYMYIKSQVRTYAYVREKVA